MRCFCCRASARLPQKPCQPPNLLLKNSEGPASEKKSALARMRTQVGWIPTESPEARSFGPREAPANDTASVGFSRWQACCPLYTEGNAQNAELLYQTAAKNTREIQNLPLCAHKTSCAARAPRKKQKLLRGKLLYSMFGRPEGAEKWHIILDFMKK